MAGKKKTIYLAYDASIEDEKSLQDFITKILSSAGYPIANIYLIDKTKIESVIDDSDYQFIISLNSKIFPLRIPSLLSCLISSKDKSV